MDRADPTRGGNTVWIVIDSDYTKRPFLREALAIGGMAGVVVVGRLRKDAALRSVPRQPKDLKDRQRVSCRLYGEKVVKNLQVVPGDGRSGRRCDAGGSWLNQIETVFGIIMRQLIRRGNFPSRENLEQRLAMFLDYDNETMAHPFHWTDTGKPTASPNRTHDHAPHRRRKLSIVKLAKQLAS